MKTNALKIVTLLLALSISIAACKKDEKTTPNSFKYNQKEAEIGTALGFAFGQTDVSGVYWLEMEFFEKAFTVHYVNNYPDSISGTGDALLLSFLTNKLTEIPSGEYVFNSSGGDYTAFTIDGEDATGLIVGYDASSGEDPTLIEISGGKVTVTKNADEYEFTFNLTTKINTTITGYYKGKPVIYTEKKKKSGNHQNWFPTGL
jgi:hypothetical protein